MSWHEVVRNWRDWIAFVVIGLGLIVFFIVTMWKVPDERNE